MKENQLTQKLIIKCIGLINTLGYTKIKKSLFKKDIITDIGQLNKVLCKYDKHTYLREIVSNSEGKKVKEDKFPIIIQKKEGVLIKVFTINSSNYEKFQYKNYNSGTSIGNRVMEIVNLIKKATEEHSKIIIDLRNCGGGDIRVFFDAFGELIGTGLLFYAKENNGKAIYCIRNKTGKIKYTSVKPKLIRKAPKINDVKILVGSSTASSAEFLAMILKDSINAKIIGGKTAGYLTLTDEKLILLENKKYILSVTISKNLYDSSERKYNGYIK